MSWWSRAWPKSSRRASSRPSSWYRRRTSSPAEIGVGFFAGTPAPTGSVEPGRRCSTCGSGRAREWAGKAPTSIRAIAFRYAAAPALG
ncbi:MAG TPA: hypothetical protein DGQ94_20555 [Pseudomonas sp.]|nr:hypothetical protein DZC31_07180 [Stenotrophomonas rhizophila]HCV41059.1 hypothetical protein [Pseudomonas sp.]